MESSCAGFFAQACPNSVARFEAILATSEAPPSPPPPPFLPLDGTDDNVAFVRPEHLLNAYDGSQAAARRRLVSLVEKSHDATRTTVIVSQSNWIGWDFGDQVDELYAVEIHLADYFPPLPPEPPSPPPSFAPRPPPPPPVGADFIFCATSNTDLCIFENVIYHMDGVCDDGGPGSVGELCALGSDATDCGFRAEVNCNGGGDFETFAECVALCITRQLKTSAVCSQECQNNPLFKPKPPPPPRPPPPPPRPRPPAAQSWSGWG